MDNNNFLIDTEPKFIQIDNETEIFNSAWENKVPLMLKGPTGSGKSTTLYAGLSEINTKDRNILTVEDPIEFDQKRDLNMSLGRQTIVNVRFSWPRFFWQF